MTAPSLNLLTQSLPENFSFYHLGEIALRDSTLSSRSFQAPLDPNDDRAALAYSFRGDIQATVVLLLEPGLDVSMYSEAGNIIASKLATVLAEKHGVDVVISPPTRLERKQLNLLASATKEIAEKTYVHSHAGKDVLLETLLLTYSSGQSPADGRSV
jgi:hypothetical protein